MDSTDKLIHSMNAVTLVDEEEGGFDIGGLYQVTMIISYKVSILSSVWWVDSFRRAEWTSMLCSIQWLHYGGLVKEYT